MSNAAITAGASPLDHNWAIGSLPCTKAGTKDGHRVLDLSKIIDSGGSSLAQLSVLECVELLAPLVGEPRPPGGVVVQGADPGDGSGGGHRRHSSLSEGSGTSRHGSVGPGRPPRLAALARFKGVSARASGAEHPRIGDTRRPAGADRGPDLPAGASRASGYPGDRCGAGSYSTGDEEQPGLP